LTFSPRAGAGMAMYSYCCIAGPQRIAMTCRVMLLRE